MDDIKSKELTPEEWMEQAKEYARRHFDYNINEDHEFWSFLKKYLNQNIAPSQAVIKAIADYGNID